MPKNEPEIMLGQYQNSPLNNLISELIAETTRLLQTYLAPQQGNDIELQYARNLIELFHQLLQESEALLQKFDHGKKPSIITAMGLMKPMKKTCEALMKGTITRQGAILAIMQEKQTLLAKCISNVKNEIAKSRSKQPVGNNHLVTDHFEFQELLYNTLKNETIYYQTAATIPGNEPPAILWENLLRQFVGSCTETTKKDDVKRILTSLKYQLKKNHLTHQIMLVHPMLHEFASHIITLVKAAPPSLQEMAPFFNPALLTLDFPILNTILPFIPKIKVELIPHDDPNKTSYHYFISAGSLELDIDTEEYYIYFQRHFLRYLSLFVSISEEERYWLSFKENAIKDIQQHQPEPLNLIESNEHTDDMAITTQLFSIQQQISAIQDSKQSRIDAKIKINALKEAYKSHPFKTLFRDTGNTLNIPDNHPILQKSLPSHLLFLKNEALQNIEDPNAHFLPHNLPQAHEISYETNTTEIENELNAAIQFIQDEISSQIRILEQQEITTLLRQQNLKDNNSSGTHITPTPSESGTKAPLNKPSIHTTGDLSSQAPRDDEQEIAIAEQYNVMSTVINERHAIQFFKQISREKQLAHLEKSIQMLPI